MVARTWRTAAGLVCRRTRRPLASGPRLSAVPEVVPLRRRRAVAIDDGAGDVEVRADLMTARIQAGPTVRMCGEMAAGAGVSTVVSKRLGLCGGYVPLTRCFSPAANSAARP